MEIHPTRLNRALRFGTALYRMGASLLAGGLSLYLKRLAITVIPDYVEEISDDDLIAICQSRGMQDDRPFRELVHRYQNIVWRTCYGVAGNAEDAEDLTQEVFFKVYRALPDFEGRSSFKTWIYRIAINTSRNELRRRKSRAQVTETAVEDMAEYLPDNVSVERDLQKQQERENLVAALEKLEPEIYELIHMKDFEQLAYKEIATRLGISLSACKMRVQRSRLALKAAYLEVADRRN